VRVLFDVHPGQSQCPEGGLTTERVQRASCATKRFLGQPITFGMAHISETLQVVVELFMCKTLIGFDDAKEQSGKSFYLDSVAAAVEAT
jgi:hypothetical protein